jgi:hypothetical protein
MVESAGHGRSARHRAVDHQVGAVDEGRLVGAEEGRGARDVPGLGILSKGPFRSAEALL